MTTIMSPRRRTTRRRRGAFLAGALVFLAGVTGCTADTRPARGGAGASHAPVDLTGTVPVRDLRDWFVADPSLAEKECYGRTVRVRAVVLNTGPSEFGTPTIEVSDVRGGDYLAAVVLPYDDRREASFRRMESIDPGQEIVASATCDVFAEEDRAVIFKNAEIID